MGEREPRHEIPGRGELYFMSHPGSEAIFSGYGLSVYSDRIDELVGILMVDRPHPVDPVWLERVEQTFGEYRLVEMTASGERGILCRMQIEPGSLAHLRQLPMDKAAAIKEALQPLLEQPPAPAFILRWNEEARLWESHFAVSPELTLELRELFENFGHGCLAVEADMGVVHVCHASDADIEGFANKPVICRWQLVKMPTAPLVRLELVILDQPDNPYMFESFLNVADEEQAALLSRLASQEQLYLAFFGDGLDYRYTKVVKQDAQQWQLTDDLLAQAQAYWASLPEMKRDFDKAKNTCMRLYP